MTTEEQPWALVTGNGAFGESAERTGWRYDVNPSSEIARRLDGEVIAGHRVRGVALEWGRHPAEAIDPILAECAAAPPAIAVALGVFSGRAAVSVERIAINVRDFQFAEDGFRPAGAPVFDEGPAAYLATLPIKAITQALRSAGIPARVSNSASTHGCNSVMYTLLHRAAERGIPMRAGFVHLPDPPEHVAALGSDGPSMAMALQIEAVREAIAAAAAHPERDLEIPANEWEW
ncbi:pyroglutamyl-peptidase I [Leucobacter triazinivorans]|uniref:Pyrrolidone-carboxylate peptidase n=1 Tax=Leucobacter triazinivorans TaxID=1784719 RepID=A0A4P6KIY7_9MICO|nr:pyroglutamyl-peptidase I [Leucobacter triazinivorans]QBE50071.1 pyroglutamyl-peptidase I [Leucobacter triazinivorans]